MALFSNKKNAPANAKRIDAMLREAFDDVFQFDDENFWMGLNGSTVVTLFYMEHSESLGSLHVNAHVIREVTVTPALCYDLLANPDYQFLVGRWEIRPDEDNERNAAVFLGADLVDYEGSLSVGELATTISLLAETADNIDDALVAKHGGKTAAQALGD